MCPIMFTYWSNIFIFDNSTKQVLGFVESSLDGEDYELTKIFRQFQNEKVIPADMMEMVASDIIVVYISLHTTELQFQEYSSSEVVEPFQFKR